MRRANSFLLRADNKEVIFPSVFIEVGALNNNTPIAIEPRYDSGSAKWITPDITEAIDGVVRIPNLSSDPVSVKKHQHLVQVYYTLTAPTLNLHNDPNEVVRLRQSHIKTQPQP